MFQEPQPQSPQQPVQDPTALFDVVPKEIPYSGNGFKAASDMLLNEEAIEQASFNAALRSFQETGKNSPELVAFRRSQRLAGLPEPTDAQEMQRYTEMQRVNLASMQKESPVLFERLKDYENAELLRRDTAAWSMGERIAGSTKRGVVEDEYGKLAFKRNYFKLSDTDEGRYQELKKELQILPQANGNWLAAAGKMLGQMYGMGAENAGWAILGAGVGSLAGPGGTGAGLYWGLTAGTAKQTFMTEAGTATQDMIDQGYDPEAAKTTGLFHGALSSAMSAVGFGATTASIRSAVRGMVTPTLLKKLGVDPAKKMLFGNFTAGSAFKRYAGGVLAEDAEEIGQELSAIMAERIAGAISRDEYQSAIQTAQGTQDISERIMAVAVETFQGMALLGLPGLAADVSSTNSRLAQAESRAKALTETIDIVRGTDAARLAPDAFADQVAEIAEKQGAEEIVMSRKHFDEAVAAASDRMRQQNPGLAPGDALLAIRNRFPELAKQLDESENSGADIRLKVADVALMSRGEFGLHTEILKRGRIVGEGMDGDTGISWEEAAKQRVVMEQLRTQSISIQARRGKKHKDAYDQVRADIDRKLQVVPQYSAQQRRFLSQVTADYYAVRAERMSSEGAEVSIIQAYKNDEFSVVGAKTKEPQVKFAETPAPVADSPAPTVQAQPEEAAPAAEGEAQPADEAAPEAQEEAQQEELLAPESLKFQQDSQLQSVAKQLFEQESSASKTPLSTAAAKRLEGLQGRQEEISKLETTLKAESERVRGLTREAYLRELESDLDKANTLLEGMDPKSDDYKQLSAWAKYTNSYLLQEAERAKAAEVAAPEVAPEVVPEKDADPVIPTVEQIAEEVLQAAKDETQDAVQQQEETGWQRKPGLDAWDKVPGKGNPGSLGTGYISGKHNDNIAARAKERGDIGLLITPLIPSYANKTENYGFIAVDNGVFSQTTPFSPIKFRKLVEAIAANPSNKSKTLFVVAPDVVGDAAATLAQFTEWATWIKSQGLPVALAAQDGLENMMDQIPWDLVDVMFIGGSTDWKVGKFDSAQQADAWGKLFVEAQQRGVPIHMGRVNTNERIAGAAQQVGAGTVDGTYLAYGPDQNLPKLEGMLDRLNKMGMDLDAQKFPELGRSPTDQELYEIAFDEDIKTAADLGAFEPALKAINAIRMESGLEMIAGKTAPKEKQKQQKKTKAVSKELVAFLGDETITELQREARKLAVGKITRDEWDATVARLKPVKEFASVPELTSIDDIKKVGKLKQQKINKPETIKDGQRIALRLDIPSWRDYKTWVVAVHEATKGGSANVRGPIAYTNAVAINNVTFSSREELSFRIAQGVENKDWAAVANGDKQPMTAEEVQAMAKEVLNNPEWVQVGFNPEMHSYFWDRKTGEPIDKADTVLQVGPLVLAKNPVYGKKSEKRFSRATSETDANYLAAVERGDMKAAQEMVDAAAKAAGFALNPIFHGTTKQFSSFDTNANKIFQRGLIFFSSNKDFARSYPTKSDVSIQESDVKVVSAYSNWKNVFDPTKSGAELEFMPELKKAFGISQNENFNQEQLTDIQRGWWMMWEHPLVVNAVLEKYDAIQMTERGSKTFATKDVSSVKSSDPVTYDENGNVIPLSQRFQAESPDIRYSREGGVAGTVDLSTLEITLTKDATVSTFLHEMSHIWLNIMFRDAQTSTAPQQVVNDANILLKWFGLNSFDEWNNLSSADRADLHERWAYNFEGYISGEEAPSRELSGIFRMFRRWLTSAWTNIRTRLNLAYREELKQLGKPVQDLPILTTEVAEVMGRLLATDEQIALNQDFQSLMSLHMTKEQWLSMGNTEAEWMEILRLQNNMANDLTEELTEQTIRGMEWLSSKNVRMLREHKAKIDEQRKKLEKQFMPELIKKRVHQARKLIQSGEILNPDGSVKLTMSEARLNLKMVRELFANDPALQARVESELGTGKTGMLFSKGVDPTQLADVLGYPDAKSMVMEMLNAPSLEEDMTTLVDAEMKSKYKDMIDPKKIQKQISAQLSGKMRQKMVAIELRGLDKNLRSESDAGQPQLVAQMEQAQTQLETLLKDEKTIRDERDALKKTEMDIRKEITKEKRKTNQDKDKIAALSTSLESTKNANMGRITEINSSLKDLNKQIRKTERLAEGPRTTVATILRAAQEVAIELMGKTLVKDALPSIYEANARMRRRGTTTAMARGESLVAIEQKRGELTQAAMAEQATEFQQEMDSFKEFVQDMFRMSRKDMAKGRDYNMAVAARGVAAAFGFGTEKQVETVTEAVKAMRVYAPELAAEVEKLLSEANQQATKISQQAQARGPAAGRSKRNRVGPLYRELTVEQMQQLMDRIKGLWKRSSEEKQVELGGVQRTVDEAANLLRAKVMERMGKPVGAANSASGIMSYVALATRAEHLMEHLDGQQVGEWQLMVYRWVKDNAVKARGEFAQKIKQLSSILADIDMRQGEKIVATELGGHVFGEDPDNPLISELMHVILHMGNPENLEKMVMGKTRRDNPQAYWGKTDEEGNLDTTDLRNFIERMIEQNVLTKQHFEAAEKIFALMDELTPGALKAYYRVNGYNMKLVKHGQISNSLGTFRGGYVPAQVDKDATPIGDIMDLKAQMNEQFSNGMPKARDGFTKERVKKGGLPRVLNVNSLPMHIRDVLFYTHLQPVMHDLSKVLTQEDLANALKAYDPAIMRNVMIPWMGRTVRQLTQTPTNNPLDKIVRKIRRNVGLDKLALSFNVMFQQFTGLSVSATRVPKRQLAKALTIWMKDPRAARKFIAGLSPAMAERFDNQMTEMMNKLEEVIQSPNAYKNFRKWAMENGMVLQAGAQNIVDSITWIGAFNEAMEKNGKGLSIEEAQKIAASDADSIVRLTQGGGFAEDLSTSEAGTVWAQLFSQFQTVFIVMMNAAGWKARTLIQDMGMMRASPRVLALAFFGLYLPLALGNLISESMRGELGDDEDMDGVSETWFRTLVMAPLTGAASGLPQVGYLINFGLNRLDNKRYNDKMGSTPVFGAFEAAVRGVGGAYNIMTDPSRELRGQDIKDWATLIATITGIPVSVLAKPASYYLDESRGFYNPGNLGAYARGMVTGTGIPTNR